MSAGECGCCGTCTCECCSGISQETPQSVQNLPGLSAIPYRVGDYQQFKDTLLARISLSRQPQLRRLTTRSDDDFTIALLDAFSVMADVLTFYTERYGNESYLRTAVERQSVVNLAGLVGYVPSPGVAASTQLAFTLDPATGAFASALTGAGSGQVVPVTSSLVTIPAGTRVQSVPNSPGENPQPFETSEDIDAQPAWNAIPPLMLKAPDLCGSSSPINCIYIASAATQLKPGDTLLLCPGTRSILATVKLATMLADGKTTRVDLSTSISAATNSQTQSSAEAGVEDVQSPELNAAAVQQILSENIFWNQKDLVLLANLNQWPLEQLEAAINQQVAANSQPPSGLVLAFRQQAAGFGFNLPMLETPPFSPPPTYDPLKGVTLDQWDGTAIPDSGGAKYDSGTIFLDSSYSQVLPASWVVLRQAGVGDVPLQVKDAKITTHSEFNTTAKVSQISVSDNSKLKHFLIRNAAILCQSENLPLAMLTINDDIADGFNTPITLDRAYLGLTVGQTVVLSGKRTDLPGVSASEVCTLSAVTLVSGLTTIKFTQALQYSYLRSSVQINANVADATHGASYSEVLGNGDGTQTFQSFTLKQTPLTYTQAATPSGTQSSLQVYVNNQLWEEVDYFFGHGPAEHIYTTARNDDATTTVTFGDGIFGSRLPTGTANVSANYRAGIGTVGLVDANQISMLTTRPLGVRAATNPLPSEGAEDAETIDDARTNATVTIMALDRIVSLQDYQDFARAFAGIAKALAVWIWDGQQRVVLLTVAGIDGAVVQPGDATGAPLQQAIANASEPFVQVQLQAYSPVYFRLAANVTVSPDFIPDDVQAEIETALRSAFSFTARNFGQGVNASEVISTIQGVDGVEGVLLTALYYSTAASSLQTYLPAAVPQTASRTGQKAELLMLDAAPLSLDVESAS